MTDDRTLERAARSWLEEGPTEAPDRAVVAALTKIQTTAQERDPWAPRRKTFMPTRLALAAAVAIVAIGGAVTLNRLIAPPSPGATASPVVSAPTVSSTPPSVAPSPMPVGQYVAFQVTTFDGLTRSSVWIQSADGSVSRELLPNEAGSWLLGRAGDGDQVLVALSGDEPSLALVDVATGEQQVVPHECPSDICWADARSAFGAVGTMTLADDDRTAVMVIRDETTGKEAIATVDLQTGETSIVEGSRSIFVPGPGLRYPRLSPDGRTVAYVVADQDPRACSGPEAGAVMIVDRLGDADTQRQVVPFRACARDPRWSPTGDALVYWTDEVTSTPNGTPTPPGGTTSVARDRHDVYRVTTAGDIERLTTDGTSAYSAWTSDAHISYAMLDFEELVPEVWIVDPASGARSSVAGTIAALGDAGCIECPFLWDGGASASTFVVGFWPSE